MDVVEYVSRDFFEERLACDLKRFEVSDRQLRLVIKHFFEMRHVPEGIHRVPVKAAAQVIVHSAGRHFAERKEIHLERVLAAHGFGRPPIDAGKKIQRHRPREFWRHTETAFVCVVASRDLLIGCLQGRRAELRRFSTTRLSLRQRRDDFRPLLRNFFVILFPRRRDPFEHFAESRLPISVLGRKISSAHEWLQLRRQPDAHGPASAAGRGLDESHVNTIDIGPFLAIDFDVHKLAVHDRRHLRALERLVRHDVAPVAGRITDGEKDRFVLASRFRERFLAPRKPVDRIMRVLEKIRRLLAAQPVGVRARWRGHRGKVSVCGAKPRRGGLKPPFLEIRRLKTSRLCKKRRPLF